MANWVEKQLPKKYREKLSTALVTALALFLSLQYNETMKKIFDTVYPLNTETIGARIIYIIILTAVIIFIIVQIEKALDGK